MVIMCEFIVILTFIRFTCYISLQSQNNKTNKHKVKNLFLWNSLSLLPLHGLRAFIITHGWLLTSNIVTSSSWFVPIFNHSISSKLVHKNFLI